MISWSMLSKRATTRSGDSTRCACLWIPRVPPRMPFIWREWLTLSLWVSIRFPVPSLRCARSFRRCERCEKTWVFASTTEAAFVCSHCLESTRSSTTRCSSRSCLISRSTWPTSWESVRPSRSWRVTSHRSWLRRTFTPPPSSGLSTTGAWSWRDSRTPSRARIRALWRRTDGRTSRISTRARRRVSSTRWSCCCHSSPWAAIR